VLHTLVGQEVIFVDMNDENNLLPPHERPFENMGIAPSGRDAAENERIVNHSPPRPKRGHNRFLSSAIGGWLAWSACLTWTATCRRLSRVINFVAAPH
jgi:hypothetical protein